MALRFELVKDDLGIAEVATIASEIWQEYWPAIIGQPQTDYMVSNFQSEAAIAQDISSKDYRYWLLHDETGACVGYTAAAVEDFTEDPENDKAIAHGPKINQLALRRLFISKIYLYAKERGKHYASETLSFYESLAKEEKCPVIYLTVNLNNELGIRAYLGRSFEIIEDYKANIGSGFVMDDHIMAKTLG